MAPPKTEACAALCDDVAESVHPNFDLLSKHGAEVKNTADAMVGGWVPSSPRSFAVKHQAMTPRGNQSHAPGSGFNPRRDASSKDTS